MAKKDSFNKLEDNFCRVYVADTSLNRTQAAIQAGYSEKGADVAAAKLWARPKIRKRCAELSKKRWTESDELSQLVITTLCKIANAEPDDFYEEVGEDVGETDFLDRPVLTKFKRLKSLKDMRNTAAITGFKPTAHGTELKTMGKEKALELLGKHMSLFTDKLEVEVKGTLSEIIKDARQRGK